MTLMKGICFLSIAASTALAFSPQSSSSLRPRANPQRQQEQVLVLKKSSSVNQQDVVSAPSTPTVADHGRALEDAKQSLLEQLLAGEDDNSPAVTPYLTVMKEAYAASKVDARYSKVPYYNGDWKNINTPAFPGRLGLTTSDADDDDKNGLPTYTIGTLTFGLIPDAKHVVCAVKQMGQNVNFATSNQQHDDDGVVVPADGILIPDALLKAVQSNPKELRTNQLDTVFEIPESPNVKGILRMEGYTIPSLDEENKYDAWFVGGRCIAQEGVNAREWKEVFGEACNLEYALPKPVTAYQTVVFLDKDFRISIGNRGSVMIVGRETVYSS